MSGAGLGWLGVLRLGLVQTALGAIIILVTSTMNRVMVVELALPAMLPGALVALYQTIQMMRPRFGYGSDMGGRRTPWIIGGMAVLATGGVGAALGTALMAGDVVVGTLVAFLSFVLIGMGVGSCGTSLLVLLAKRVDAGRRAAAATLVWVMMIAGFAVTAGVAGHFLDPFSPGRLVGVTAVIAGLAFMVTLLAVRNLEGPTGAGVAEGAAVSGPKPPFREALAEVWAEPQARRFTIFVFVSMLAYSAQDLILEPFAGLVFGMTPGESTQLAGVQHGGVLAGMILFALVGTLFKDRRAGLLRLWTAGGCVASAAALLVIAASGFFATAWSLPVMVFALGLANGAFAAAAIASMMAYAGEGRSRREGVRMGLWGAAQAIAFGLGGFLGTVAIDVARLVLGSPAVAYALVFTAEGLMFLVAALLAVNLRVQVPRPAPRAGMGILGPGKMAGQAAGGR